jgi:uncharacterized protein YjbI with pentapeptide repeats
VEPTIAITALAKLIGLGMKGWAAIETRGVDDNDVTAIQTLLETGAWFSSARKPVNPTVAAQHLALIARAFGLAVGRHQEFHGKLQLSSGLRRWFNRSDRERADEIALRVQAAALHLHPLGNEPRNEVDLVAALTGSPLDTSYYRKLWQAFSDPSMTLPEEEPPLVMSRGARREFERYFLLAYLTVLESPAGRGVAAYLDSLQRYRAQLVRDLLVQDMAAWGERHVFGNVPRERWTDGDFVPFLPLDALYVEMDGVLDRESGAAGDPEPLLALLERLATADSPRPVVLVVADFGTGKSLSARMLARRWAELALRTTSVSLDALLPIYVRCAEDLPHEAVDLAATVRRAWKRQADGFGLALSEDDEALLWPAGSQRMVCLLDGLDEVSLGDQHLKTLLQRLHGKTTARHRFIVFSRPGAVPPLDELGNSVAVVRVQPFRAPQIERWIACWNQARPGAQPVTLSMIEKLGLDEVVRTPILLFMVAFTWEGRLARSLAPTRAEIYNGFFEQIATGKAAVDQERHRPIAAASEALLVALRNHRILDDRAELRDAMLWLMARVAWEAQILDQRHPPEPLTRRHIDNLLQDGDLCVPTDAAHAIRIGLVLTLQSELRTADHHFLFGHQSFREFLVGRYWAMQLHQIVRESPRAWDDRTAALLGGRLLGEENRSLEFLVQIVNAVTDPRRPVGSPGWTDPERTVLVRWAQEVFSDEGQAFIRRDRPGVRGDVRLRGEMRLRDDARTVLREAALAIGSLTHDSPGLSAPDVLTLRSMLAWFWLHRLEPCVIAPGANLAGSRLDGVSLRGARLDRARLEQVRLSNARLDRVVLIGARLAAADLQGATLAGVVLDGADLTEARLTGARVARTSLVSACLDDAHLQHTQFDDCNLSAASLRRARLFAAILSNSCLHGANLEGAELAHAQLVSANLENARLTGANLDSVNLRRARLRGADLSSANLVNADLRAANLLEARVDAVLLEGASFDEQTLWPEGFDPTARGASRARG